MNEFLPIVLMAPPELAIAFNAFRDTISSLESIESLARDNALDSIPFIGSVEWKAFSSTLRGQFEKDDYLILKGLPVNANGGTLLGAAQAIGLDFRTYRGGKIVKHFKMTPWTTELSHTTHDGEFHTDLNTESFPPAITAMQCCDPDPGSPNYGVSRVARLSDLLNYLREHDESATLRFLTEDSVTMLNDHSSSSWTGHVVDGNTIRYHPETLRDVLEERIAAVSRAAFAASRPFTLDRGDILFLSNHRTMHYRGECSVVFNRYPTEFASRSIFILHAHRERKA